MFHSPAVEAALFVCHLALVHGQVACPCPELVPVVVDRVALATASPPVCQQLMLARFFAARGPCSDLAAAGPA